MKIKYAALDWYGRIFAGLAIPLVILDFSEPSWWTPTCSKIAFGVLFVLAGIPVILFWTRIIKIEFVFSKNDERKMSYKRWKSWCERSGRSILDGSKLPKSDQ
jgi:hypothetical protein